MAARRIALLAGAACAWTALIGCSHTKEIMISPVEGMPRELKKTTLPEYVIEPPDVLQVDLVAAVPRPPYKLQPLDAISVRVPEAAGADEPIAGVYQVELDGTVNFGGSFGNVPVAGLTLPQAKEAITAAVQRIIQKPTVDIGLAQGRGLQQVRGPHLVRGDGTIGLGNYGSVRVVGLTIPDAKRAIEAHLSVYFLDPEISLDISGFNSKVYYLIVDGGSAGSQVVRLPLTGNETVLDAMSQIGGLPAISDPKKVWVSRPSVEGCPDITVLPVDWQCITELGDTRTNYQLMNGDRVFVKAYPMIAFTNAFSRVIAPIERALGFTLLGVGAYRNISGQGFGGGFGGFGGVGGF